jgi:hypothetical protein
MRIKTLLHLGISLVLTGIWTSNVAGQSTLVGEIRGGTPVLTDAALAQKALQTGLQAGATLSDLSILASDGTEKTYFLVSRVTGANYSAKGIQLQQSGAQLYAVAGPGIEITCIGRNCSMCVIKLKGIKPYCVCEMGGPGPDAPQCDAVIKATIEPW